MYIILNNELYHHGIKGQKWGVRRFQNTDGSLTSSGRQRYSTDSKGRIQDNNSPMNQIKSKEASTKPSKIKDILQRNSQATKGVELSEDEKAAIISASAVALSMVALRTLSKATFVASEKSEQKANKKDNPFSAVKKTKPAKNKEDDMAKINPDFGRLKGSTSNCVLCTTAYEMRRRGYDVTANFSSIGRDTKRISEYYKDTTKKDWVKTKRGEQNIMKAFDDMPDGSRGNICANVGVFASKHSMVWEKEGGKVTIRDCQSNKVYDSKNLLWKNGSKGIVRTDYGVEILRTDNREINTDAIMDAIRPVDK